MVASSTTGWLRRAAGRPMGTKQSQVPRKLVPAARFVVRWNRLDGDVWVIWHSQPEMPLLAVGLVTTR